MLPCQAEPISEPEMREWLEKLRAVWAGLRITVTFPVARERGACVAPPGLADER